MSSDLDDIQALAIEEARKIYTDIAIDHAMNPRNTGQISKFDGYAKITGPCGDTVEVWIKVEKNKIAEIKFMTDGCGTSIASCSMMTELSKNCSIINAKSLSQQDVLNALGGLPEENSHCALLAINALNASIADYFDMKNNPWKKLYRHK